MEKFFADFYSELKRIGRDDLAKEVFDFMKQDRMLHGFAITWKDTLKDLAETGVITPEELQKSSIAVENFLNTANMAETAEDVRNPKKIMEKMSKTNNLIAKLGDDEKALKKDIDNARKTIKENVEDIRKTIEKIS
jgi:hypothetical protein